MGKVKERFFTFCLDLEAVQMDLLFMKRKIIFRIDGAMTPLVAPSVTLRASVSNEEVIEWQQILETQSIIQHSEEN